MICGDNPPMSLEEKQLIDQLNYDLEFLYQTAKKKEEELDYPASSRFYKYLYDHDYVKSFKDYAKILLFGKPKSEKFNLVPKNEKLALELLISYVKMFPKDLETNKLIGYCFINGIGTTKDELLALGAFEIAAELNDVSSYLICGKLFMKKDVRESIKWYEKAIESGVIEAYSLLGAIYYKGVLGIIQQDLEKAISLFKKGVEKGDKESYSYLGYDCFYGLKKDKKLGKEYFEKGIEKGTTNCMFYLGEIYFYGVHLEKDVLKGLELLVLSKSLKNEKAILLLEEIEKKESLQKIRENELIERMIDFISKKDLKKFEETIRMGGNVNGLHVTEPLISFVVSKDLFEFFKLLIENGANINCTDIIEPFNPLSVNIVSYKQLKYLKYLLDLPIEKGFQVNKSSITGINILIASIISKQKDFIELILKDGRINLSLKYQEQFPYDLLKDDKDLKDFYKNQLIYYRKLIYSGDKVILFNIRTQTYIGQPEYNSDQWEIGKLNENPLEHILLKSKQGPIQTNEIIRIQATKTYHEGFNNLYASSGGWGFYDQLNQNEKKQEWKIIKLNLLKEDRFTREHEIFTGDIIRFENIYYPSSNLYASTNHYLSNSYFFTDKWAILKNKN